MNKLKEKEDEISKLRSTLLSATNHLSQLSKNSAKKQKGIVYKRNNEYYARWTNIPAKIIAEFQATKEDPKAIYRDLRYCTIQEPEKLTHAHAVKLIRRYKEALPEGPGLLVAKQYLQIRLEELRKMELKDTYTRSALLRQMATVMSENDAHIIRNYLDANQKSVPMRELANAIIKNRMQNYLRQTSTKPAEQILPLNHTNRQHMLLHRLAVDEKPLPNALKARTERKRPFGKQKNDHSFKKGKANNGQQRQFQQNSPKPSTKNFQGAQRPSKGQQGQQRNQASRGQQQQPQPAKVNGQRKSYPKTPAEAVVAMKNAYDFSKIADKLSHFGTCTPDVQLMLAHQLEKRDIPIEPKTKTDN